jgi:hypothetical protein
MKLLRIAAVAALTAFGGITGGASLVQATPSTGVLLGVPAVKTLQTPTTGTLPLEKAYYYYRRHYWHPITGTITGAIGIGAIGKKQSASTVDMAFSAWT